MRSLRNHRGWTGVVLFALLSSWTMPALAAGAGRDSTGASARSDKSGGAEIAEKVYEIGKAWYEHYQAYEEKRNDVSLMAPNRVEVTPAVIKVTENAMNRLPGAFAKAGVAWVPFCGQTTNVFWEFQVGGGKGGSGSISQTGVPSKDEWDSWYADRGPYPYAGKFSNDHIKFTFDATAEGEAFNEGINTVRVKLWGWTRVCKNYWNPLNWFGSPVETKAFDETVSQEKDVAVELPYAVRKDPNLDVVELPHPATLTVRLWDKNLARAAFKGNIQNYDDPRVRVLCDNGTIPPDEGTSNNEMVVCSDTRTHTGSHPPVRIHVLPDFDPISVTVKHIVWDLPENQGKIYLRPLTLRPTQLWCVQPGYPDSVPNTPTPDGGNIPVPTQNPRRTVVTPSPQVMDPEYGPQPVQQQVRLELISHGVGAPPETLWVDGSQPLWTLPEFVLSGDVVELRWTTRDIFGRSFASSQMLNTPPAGDVVSSDSVYAPPAMLQLVNREHEQAAGHPVEMVCVDLAAAAFNEPRTVPGVMIMDMVNGQVHVTDPQGRATESVTDAARMQLRVYDTQQKYLPLMLPLSPPVLKSLKVQTIQAQPGFQDDRLYLWMSPSFLQGHLVPGAGRVRHDPDGYHANVGAVSDLNPTLVQQARFEHLDGSVIGPALVEPWGNSDQRGLGYLPARFRLDEAALNQGEVQHLVSDGLVRLRVTTQMATDAVLDIPLTFNDLTTNAPESRGPVPAGIALASPQPNPTAGTTTIRYALPAPASVRLAIYDVQGRQVATLLEGEQPSGTHEVSWDARDTAGATVPSGTYFIRMTTADGSRTQRLLIVR